MSLRSNQDGALSPGFLMFIVAAAVASLFLVQFAHAHVLRTEAHTAADAAALAGAKELRTHLLATRALGAPPPVIDEALMAGAAANYANANDATLTDFDRTGPCTVQVSVTGQTNVTSGPSSELQEGLPKARAQARVQLPPLTGLGVGFSCATGRLELLDPALVPDVGPDLPDAVDEFDEEEPDPDDYPDDESYEEAYDEWVEERDAYEDATEAFAAAMDTWKDAVSGWAFGLLRNGSEIRLIPAD